MGFGGVLALIAVFAVCLFLALFGQGIIGSNMLIGKKDVKKDATITKISPVVEGARTSKHFYCYVEFSDGSFYKSRCNVSGAFRKIYYDQKREPIIVQQAIKAHDEAVKKAELKAAK